MTTLPEEAVKAAVVAMNTGDMVSYDSLSARQSADARRILTAAIPFLPVQGAVKEAPLGAIENGRVFLQRLADHYDFTCEAGSLANCTDYHEAVRCFEFIAQWVS
ncbi:hypothetical protein, partial [Brucella anthropi]